MELKLKYQVCRKQLIMTFNRTAYGIEITD